MTNEKIKEIIKNLEKITYRGNNRYQIFDDWLNLMINALIGNDEKYLKIVKCYKNEGEIGRREIDYFHKAFHDLMTGMAVDSEELLGDIYMDWNISNKHTGQYFTPKHVARFMAQI